MVKVAVVGVGYWGPNFVRNMDELAGCELVAVCDTVSDKAKKIKETHPHLEFTDDFDSLIEGDKVDAVVIATGSDSHYKLARKALEKNKHVLVEKPMALKVVEAEELVKLAEERNLVLLVGHLLRYHNGLIKLKEYMDDGYLGKILYAYTTRVNLGKIRKEESALWSFATHDISVVNYLLGGQPESVTASGQAYVREGVEDVVFATLHFPKGVMAHLHVSWLDPHKIRKVTVVGNKKMAVLDDMQATEKLRIYDKGVDFTPSYGDYGESLSIRIGDIYIPKINMSEPLKTECKHFLECIEKGEKPLTDGKTGLEVLRVLEAAEQSLAEGSRTVKIGG